MEYSLDKYKYFKFNDANGKVTISAVSTYGGRTVKGYAKCDPRDTYDFEAGKRLAAARCNQKVAQKRARRAATKFAEAEKQLRAAEAYYAKMANYFNEASASASFATNEVNCLVSEM